MTKATDSVVSLSIDNPTTRSTPVVEAPLSAPGMDSFNITKWLGKKLVNGIFSLTLTNPESSVG